MVNVHIEMGGEEEGGRDLEAMVKSMALFMGMASQMYT